MNSHILYRPDCDLCGSGNKRILISKQMDAPPIWNFLESYYEGRLAKNEIAGMRYEVVKCLNCSYIWQAYILGPELTDKLYNVWISSKISLKKKAQANISLYSKYAKEMVLISQLLCKNPWELRLLDYGMGWGQWCLMAKAFSYDVSGLEISAERIENAKAMNIDAHSSLNDFSNNKFDFINSEQVFEHLPNPLETLMAIVKKLKPFGIIRISTPNCLNIESKLRHHNWQPRKDSVQPLEHINGFTNKTLKVLGRKAGLDVLQMPIFKMDRHSMRQSILNTFLLYYSQQTSTTLYFQLRNGNDKIQNGNLHAV